MIHCFKKNGFNIVLDVNSGSVHNVDDVAFDMIEMYETHTPEQIILRGIVTASGKPYRIYRKSNLFLGTKIIEE